MRKLILSIFLLSISMPAFSIGVVIKDKNELLGCWKRVIYSDETMKQMNKFNIYHPVHQKYQWFCFFEDERLHVLTSSKDVKHTTESLKKYFKNYPKLMTWKWIQNSAVETEHKQDSDSKLLWATTRIDKEMKVFGNNVIPKNSVFMGIPTKDLRNFIITRILVKI